MQSLITYISEIPKERIIQRLNDYTFGLPYDNINGKWTSKRSYNHEYTETEELKPSVSLVKKTLSL